MNEARLKELFPRASADFLAANCVSDSEPCERTEALARDSKGKAQGPGLRLVRFTLHRKQLLDVDAKYASVKDLLDCLTISGVIRGDKEGQIRLEVEQAKICKGEQETTEITVYEL